MADPKDKVSICTREPLVLMNKGVVQPTAQDKRRSTTMAETPDLHPLKINLDDYKLLHENLLVRRERPVEFSKPKDKDGKPIILPKTEQIEQAPFWATIVKIGAGVTNTDIRIGVRVLFNQHNLQEFAEIGGLYTRGDFCEYGLIAAKDIVLVSKAAEGEWP